MQTKVNREDGNVSNYSAWVSWIEARKDTCHNVQHVACNARFKQTFPYTFP